MEGTADPMLVSPFCYPDGGVYGVEPQECALRVNTDVHIPGQTADMGCYITEKGKRDMTEREHEEEHYAIG